MTTNMNPPVKGHRDEPATRHDDVSRGFRFGSESSAPATGAEGGSAEALRYVDRIQETLGNLRTVLTASSHPANAGQAWTNSPKDGDHSRNTPPAQV